jgi:hypothetical protein
MKAMMTYWVTFATEAGFGVVIVDGDDAWDDKTIVRKIIKLGCKPKRIVRIQRLCPGTFDPISKRYKNRLLARDEVKLLNAGTSMTIFDLIIGLKDTGAIMISVNFDAGLDDLIAQWAPIAVDKYGRACVGLCGGGAKKALSAIMDRQDLAVSQYFFASNTFVVLRTGEDRKRLLASIGQHSHTV